MKRKPDLLDEKDKTQDAVAQITSWCIAVAVHQRYGVGRDRLERVAAVMAKVQDEIAAIVEELGTAKGMAVLQDKLGGICETEFPVPLNRAPRNWREQELRRTGDTAATAAWCCFAVGMRDVLGFGTERLNAVRAEALLNYRQFNEWAREDLEWALTRLQHCAEQAMRQEIPIIQEAEKEPVRGPIEELEMQRAIEKNVQAAVAEKMRRTHVKKKAVNVLSDKARRAAAMEIEAMPGEAVSRLKGMRR